MKDTSRPNHRSPSRPTPYRKRKASSHINPTRGTRRAQDASQPRSQRPVSPRAQERARNSRRDDARPSRAEPFADDEPNSQGTRISPPARKHTDTDGSAPRERPGSAHTSSFSVQADTPGPPLRLPITSAPPAITASATSDRKKTESPPPGSVTAFLRSIQLPDKPASVPPLQTDSSSSTPSLPSPPSPGPETDNGAYTDGNGYQVNLAYKGHSFTYELSTLPDDPNGTIALLTLTKSDPGPYLLVAAHYRRTGRSRAACAVIRSLLDNLDVPTDVQKGKEDAVLIHTSDTPIVALPCPGTPCPKSSDSTVSVAKRGVMRPAMLLLAACELDISREYPDSPESASHACSAYGLFRAVYGAVNDAIIAGAVHSPSKNALGLDFSSNGNYPSSSSSNSNGRLPSITLPPDPESLARVKNLEEELDAAREEHKKLQERLYVSNNRLSRAEDKVHGLESHSREVRMRLDVSRDENWELRQRLADSERKARELTHCAPPSESRVWGRLKGLLFDNLGGGVR